MPRKFSRTLGWFAALTVALPATAALAQEPLPQTHTVRKGDTLWDLAQHYLKDPFLWPGIYRQNTDVVEDPHWIYPGEILRIAPVDNVAAVPTMDTPPPAAPLDTAPVATPDSAVAVADGPQQPSMAEGEGQSHPEAETQPEDQAPLFQSSRKRTVAEILKAYTNQPYRALRRSEFYSSGFLTENQRLPYGRVLGPVTPQQIKAAQDRASALPYTIVAIQAPGNATYEVGDSLLVVQLGGEIEPYGRIVVPTGVAQVTEMVDGNYLASIVATYNPIRNGQRVLPLESFSAASGARAVAVADGVKGSLLGGFGRQDLKEPQMVVFIDRGREHGVAPGDLFEVRRRPQRMSDGTLRVNEVMATLQIVHVRDRTATAVVLNVISPDIPPGTDVLQVAKLPS
ncbi:MAG TPA: LysM peptidoglycan-binding domain-containing protein [Gemmatimonadales bacterium]|nr:LysM peptidoglycan-binding domain-containing protein [Gemmatimonadales bacterium]